MNKNLLHTEIQRFIDDNLNADISKLLFKGSLFPEVTIQELVEQIESKKKAEWKLPTWFKTPGIYYPSKLNIEQTSSEITARYKANLLKGHILIDITGGFGVDSYYFSRTNKKVIHCEHQKELSVIVNYNFQQLQAQNIECISTDGISYVQQLKEPVDCLYIDPSRRNEKKGKVFLLEDCEPNIPKHITTLFDHSPNLLIKASPMLDISQGIKALKNIKEVHIVAVENEVKELLFLLEKNYSRPAVIKTVNIKKKTVEKFNASLETLAKSTFSTPKKYMYEPNAAILKAGLFNEVSFQLKINKFHNNSHLYTSKDLIEFPGRRFEIIRTIPYSPKEIKKLILSHKANITTRNFPESVAQIRKKTKLKDGGDHYLFFTTDLNEKHIVLICKKV